MNNKGVSAVIGVILMVAITVAIASTVYVYVNTYFNPINDKYFIKTGNFKAIQKLDNNYMLYINNNSIFLTEFEQSYFTENYLMQYMGYNVSVTVKYLDYNYPDTPRYRLMDINIIGD